MTNTRRMKYLSLILLMVFSAGWNTCSFNEVVGPDPSISVFMGLNPALGPAGVAVETPEDLATAAELVAPTSDNAEDTGEELDRELMDPIPPAIASLPLPSGMEGRVRLWEMVFGECDRSRFVLYHRDRPGTRPPVCDR